MTSCHLYWWLPVYKNNDALAARDAWQHLVNVSCMVNYCHDLGSNCKSLGSELWLICGILLVETSNHRLSGFMFETVTWMGQHERQADSIMADTRIEAVTFECICAVNIIWCVCFTCHRVLSSSDLSVLRELNVNRDDGSTVVIIIPRYHSCQSLIF